MTSLLLSRMAPICGIVHFAMIAKESAMKLNDILADETRLKSLVARFWPKVKKAEIDECWDWIAKAKHPFGYGRMTAGRGVNLKAHQVSYALANGPIPSVMNVLHSCDRPSCCNPNHLRLGTQKDNSADAVSRKRNSPPPHRMGAAHHNAKFTDEIARVIATDRRSARVVAAEYGICEMTVYRHRKGIAWAA